MFVLRFRALGLHVWPQLWLLLMASPLPEWAPYSVQPNSEPLGPNVLSPYESSLQLESLCALTALAEPGGFDYLESSVPTKMSLLAQELTGELLPESDKFAAPHQGLHDKLPRQEGLQEEFSMLDGDWNQALALPPQLKRRTETSAFDQAAIHQSLKVSPSSTASQFVSPLKPKKDVAQHWQLAKGVFGTLYRSAKPKAQKQTLQDVGQLAAHQEVNVPSSTSDETHPLSLPNVTFRPKDIEVMITAEAEREAQPTVRQQQSPGQSPENTEELEPSSFQEEAPSPPLDPPMKTEPSPSEQEPPVQRSEITKGVEPSESQPKATAQPTKPCDEVKLPVQEETQVPESPLKSMAKTPPCHEVTLRPPDQYPGHHYKLPTLKVEPVHTELTITPEAVKEVESSLAQQGAPDLSSVSSEQFEPWKAGQVVTAQQPDPFVINQGVLGQPEELPEEHSLTQQESSALSSKQAVGVTLSIVQQELSAPPPGPWQESGGSFPLAEPPVALQEAPAPLQKPPEMTLARPDPGQAQHPNLPPVTAQLLDVERTRNQYTVNYTPEKSLTVQQEQRATRAVNLCELCTCENGTLSCTGLSPAQRLHQVPTLEPSTHRTTFHGLVRILPDVAAFFSRNFQGNFIHGIQENTWKTYRWAEKLNLSENYITELRKGSFEGLLSLQSLDLSCNKIHFIERRTFEALPFLQFINLRCNLLTELSFGTFQAWHGMQFLHQVILNHNPLTTIEDSSLFKLSALKYLDLGQTHVSLTALKNVLAMALELERLILPSRMVCCLCQFKNDIEVVSKTVKLQCDGACPTSATQCLGESPTGSPREPFVKALEARKKSTSTELTIGPDKSPSGKSSTDPSGFVKEQLDISDERDIISALNYMLPYFSEGSVEGVESTLLPFIQLLFSDGDNSLGHLESSSKNSSFQPALNNSNFKNELKKLYFLQNSLDTEIQGKIVEANKKEKTATLMPSSLLRPKFRCRIFPKTLESAQVQEKSLTGVQPGRERLQRMKMVLTGLKHGQKSIKEVRKQKVRVKWSAQPILEDVTKERSHRRPIRGELEQNHRGPRPRKLAGNSFHTEPSTEKQKAAISPFLVPHLMGSSPSCIPAQALPEVRKRANDVTYNILVSENADARVKTMQGTKPRLHSEKRHHVHKTHSLMARGTSKADPDEKPRKENAQNSLMLAKRAPFLAMTSLIKSPLGQFVLSSGTLSVRENPLANLHAPSEPSGESRPAENHTTADAPEGKDFALDIHVLGETFSDNITKKNPAAGSALASFNLMPTVTRNREAQWEHPNKGTGSPPKEFTSPTMSSPGDQLEVYLNQQLWPLIPNNDVRRLISQVIKRLKMDCSETHVQLACAKLISRTGLLMKLLSEQQEVMVSKAQWDMEHWKIENYINETSEDQSEEKEQESRELTVAVPGYGYNNKLILTLSVTGVAMICMIIFCLIEIYSHKRASEENEEGSSRNFSRSWLGSCKVEHEMEEDVSVFDGPLWLRDMYRSISPARVRAMASMLHDKDSSHEDEISPKDIWVLRGVTVEAVPTELAIQHQESEALKEVLTE